MQPSDFSSTYPIDSVSRKAEKETTAQNIMIILKRTGNQFRKMSWEEYVAEMLKDGHTVNNQENFNDVVDYTSSEIAARLFCPSWKKIQ